MASGYRGAGTAWAYTFGTEALLAIPSDRTSEYYEAPQKGETFNTTEYTLEESVWSR